MAHPFLKEEPAVFVLIEARLYKDELPFHFSPDRLKTFFYNTLRLKAATIPSLYLTGAILTSGIVTSKSAYFMA